MSGTIIFEMAVMAMIIISLVVLMVLVFLDRRLRELTEADLISIDEEKQQ